MKTQRGIAATKKDLSHHRDAEDTEKKMNFFVWRGDDRQTKSLSLFEGVAF